MKRNKTTNEQSTKGLVFEYEAMSQKGTVGFYEKAVFLQLIDHYINEQLFDNALEVIEHAINQHPFSEAFHLIQAQLFIEKNREDLALDALDKALVYAPSVFEVQILRAEALGSMGEFEEAFEILDDLLPEASPEQRSEIFLSKAFSFESRKRYRDMFDALKQSIKANPENMDALERIWFCVEMTQAYDESIKFHKQLIDIDPYCYIAWYNLGYAYSAKGDHQSARDAFEYAFIINDKFEFAYRECAESCIKLNEFERALRCYEELLEHFEPDADLLMQIGLCHAALGEIEKAKSYFVNSRALDENNDLVYFHLGNCFFKERNYESAIAAFKKAMMIDGLKEEYYLALAEVYHKTDAVEQAENYFQKATDIAPDRSNCWIHYARFLMERGKQELALSVLDEAELYTFGSKLKYCRIACLFSLDNRPEALNLLKKVLAGSYKSHDFLFEMAPTLKDDNDIQDLIATYSLK